MNEAEAAVTRRTKWLIYMNINSPLMHYFGLVTGPDERDESRILAPQSYRDAIHLFGVTDVSLHTVLAIGDAMRMCDE